MSSPSYVEEQQAIKESFKDALDDNSDDEDILKPRIKTKEEQVNFNIFNIKLVFNIKYIDRFLFFFFFSKIILQ